MPHDSGTRYIWSSSQSYVFLGSIWCLRKRTALPLEFDPLSQLDVSHLLDDTGWAVVEDDIVITILLDIHEMFIGCQLCVH